MRELLLGCILATSITQAQVGIGTTSPQEQLHIANGDVRVDNLKPDATSGTNVSVDANGTLILSNNNSSNNIISGKIGADGNAIKINGATCTKIDVGKYKIEFNSLGDYIILLSYKTLNQIGNDDPNISYSDQTLTSFIVNIENGDNGYQEGTPIDLEFMFKVEGI